MAGPPSGSVLLRRYGAFVVRRPILVLVALALASLPLLTGIRQLRLGMRVEDIIPQQHPHTVLFHRIRELFGLEKTAMIAIEARGAISSPPMAWRRFSRQREKQSGCRASFPRAS